MDKPEALELADRLQTALNQIDEDDNVVDVARWFTEGARDELRRLHAENEALKGAARELIEGLESIRELAAGTKDKVVFDLADEAIAKWEGKE